jgi:hypothetical protein
MVGARTCCVNERPYWEGILRVSAEEGSREPRRERKALRAGLYVAVETATHKGAPIATPILAHPRGEKWCARGAQSSVE